MSIFKWLSIPSGQKVEVKAYENWTVRWYSRHSEYSSGTRPECEVFVNKEDATKFAEQLKEAFKLIKHSSGTSVSVERTKLR